MGINLIDGAKMVAPAIGRTVLASVSSILKCPINLLFLSLMNFGTQIKKPKEIKGLPTDDPGYAETLQLMRQLLAFTSASRVEDLGSLTNARIPHPASVIIDDVDIPEEIYPRAAEYIQEALGPVYVDLIGETWWQWRMPGNVVKAEWVEMRADRLEREARGDTGTKVMFYSTLSQNRVAPRIYALTQSIGSSRRSILPWWPRAHATDPETCAEVDFDSNLRIVGICANI